MWALAIVNCCAAILAVVVSTTAHRDKRTTNDPEERMSPLELITSKGYPGESHVAITDDGYMLAIQRIPHGKHNHLQRDPANRSVIFLQHGLLCSSTNWLTNLENESFDAGYDVWLGNFRGNTYSRDHLWLSAKSYKYWQFTWDQMGEYDLPAMINYVLEQTGHNHIYYVGHSMGTMTMFAKLSKDQEFSKKIKKFFALGPVSTVGHIQGPLQLVAQFTTELEDFLVLLGTDEFSPHTYLTYLFAHYVCGTSVMNPLCKNMLFLISGPDPDQLNKTRIPIYIAHTPAGTSTNNVVHFGQLFNSKRFCKFDYGERGNHIHYGTTEPPEYDLSKVNVPTYLYWGGKDWLADPTDVSLLASKLSPGVLQANVGFPSFNHLDFVWGIDVVEPLYKVIISEMKADC